MSNMTVTRRDDVEEIIVQALGNSERRNIIEILGTSIDGVTYSEILGEIGLNTGKMNYHLKLLEGIIERDKNRRYMLTPIGRKAFVILTSMTEDLENGYEEYLGKARQGQGTGILKIANIWFMVFALLSISAVAGVWFFIKFSEGPGGLPPSYMIYFYGLVLLMLPGLYFIRKWSHKHAESVQELFNKIIGKLNKR
ncbi:winged helix-turn-helix domain-containing protein [Thermoproteota archaeon]